ncbi:hypothetical protein PHLCEN_2v4017 [Hermanssonia centrifuga]|uniref:Uncharacterized protein n=1 Tax=Hermanssonia centrifuga TaxID=98765 RepID=A0A2R6Q7C7_9APHY|nr:hypothetical protein PHLCEN_2v4017 [Hermanssonia centrifuga]
MALADAQNLAIRKLLTRAAYESTVTPGPPLPKSHPSPALASKLHLECAALYTSARALAKTAGASRPALSPTSSSAKSKFKLGLGGSNKDGSSAEGGGGGRDDADEVVPELRRYLSDEIAVHNALAHKWLGVDAGENGGPQQTGTAVGFLTWSKKELEDLKNGGSAGGMAVGTMGTEREKEMREARKARVLGDLESVNVFFKGYKRMNDSIVPPQSDLQASIPAGRMAIAIRAYTKPVPAFGPGSADYVQKMAEELESLGVGGEGGGGGDSSGTSPAVPPHKAEASYAGAGSYY